MSVTTSAPTVPAIATPTAIVWARLQGHGVDIYQSSAPFAVEGSGALYVVLVNGERGWARGPQSGISHPRVYVNIYSDCSRDDDGLPTALDGHSRALGAYEVLDALLDGTTQHHWPQVVSCRRDGEPTLHGVPATDDDGNSDAVLLSCVYELAVIL